MSGISSGSVSELFLDDSGSWSLSVMMDDDDEIMDYEMMVMT